ncbi:odorant receptor 45a-like [Cochliomyia hominivorax]
MSQQHKAKHQEFLTVPRITFASIGIDFLALDHRKIFKYPIISCVHYILTLIFAVASLDFCFNSLNDMNEFTFSVSVLNQLFIALWKMVIFFKKRQRIHKLIQQIRVWNMEAKMEDLEIISYFGSKTNFVSKLYYFAVCATGVIGLYRPIAVKIIKIIRGLEGELEVPHKIRFPWHTTTIFGYLTAYVWNFITIHFLISASVAIDTLFLWLVSNILMRFTILAKRFQKASQQNLKCLARKLIIENVKFHCLILDLARELNAIYAEIIFLQSLISCTQICFLVFRLMSKNISIISTYYTLQFLTAVSMQLFFYCYSGEMIKAQSLLVGDDIFASFNWSAVPRGCQKNLQMIMLRSQKSCNITGIFFNLDLNLYLWFFKTAGSLIAVLKTLEENV